MSQNPQPMHAQPIEQFLDALASKAATPGGGAAAALSGAAAAALVAMVCNLTIGRKGMEAVEPAMRGVLERAEQLRLRLTALMAQDARAFDALMAAWRLPQTDDTTRVVRAAAIQAGLHGATEAPLECARAAAAVIALCGPAAEDGNRNVVSDAGVAALCAAAALEGAALNVRINLPQLRDRVWAQEVADELQGLLDRALPEARRVHGRVQELLG